MADQAAELVVDETSAPDPRALPDCAARRDGGLMHCERCDLTWNSRKQRPYCDPITFGKMRLAAAEAGLEIEAFQQRQVDAGHVREPAYGQMRKAAYFRRLSQLLLTISERPDILAKLKGRS